MKRWYTLLILLVTFSTMNAYTGVPMGDDNDSPNIIQISQQLLLNAKRHESTDSLAKIVAGITEEELSNQLPFDNQKKAFWINIYNAYTQILLFGHPERYRKRSSFFGSREIMVAGKQLSLDDIEHGILRKSKVKWSEGYFTKWFPSAFEKRHRVDTLDYRIHFTLNCGAKSCPPIAFYRPEQLDKQMETASRAYLKGESDYKEAENTIYLPTMMSWFRGDFGGKTQMRKLLHRLGVITQEQEPTIKFKKYDWNLFLENYKTTNDG